MQEKKNRREATGRSFEKLVPEAVNLWTEEQPTAFKPTLPGMGRKDLFYD